jgi:twinkle protein
MTLTSWVLRVGVIYLEQNVVETSQRVMGKLDKKLYHVPDMDWTRQEYEESVDRLEEREQLYMMEHFGAMGWRSIKNIIKFFNKAYDIDHIYLDHLTALSANEQDERRALGRYHGRHGLTGTRVRHHHPLH